MTELCPKCNEKLPFNVIRGRHTLKNGEQRIYRGRIRKQHSCVANRIFNALCDHPYGLTVYQLAEIVYRDDLTGGPDDASTCLHVRLVQMNRKWEKSGAGLRIRGNGGPGSIYKVWIVK